MERIKSKITSQGQVSIPAKIRQILGLGPGSKVEWRVRDDRVTVCRASKYTSEDIHDALFDAPPNPRTIDDMDEGIRRHLREKHARG